MGTDIRLQFTLDELSDYDATSIKQLRCYVIRKEDIQYIDLDNYGYPQYYSPTDYDLVYTRCHMYNWLPYNQEVYTSGMFGQIDDYRYFPAYNGFGVRSKQFKIVPDKYLAPSRVISGSKQIEMYFPAADQRNFGEYIVLIVITVYEPGWGSNNLRTFTINKGVQFEIVDEYKNKEEEDLQLGETVEYDGYKFESKKVLAKYKREAPNGYHKVVEIYKSKIDDQRYEQTVKEVKLFQNENIYNFVTYPDTNTYVSVWLNGENVTEKYTNRDGICSFYVTSDGYKIITTSINNKTNYFDDF